MLELGQLEMKHAEFTKRGIKIVAISNDDQQTAQATQADFPHLLIVSDPDQNLAKAVQVIDAGVGPRGSDSNAPTTFFVDGTGQVRWWFRPDRFMVRLSPEHLLAAIDEKRGN